MQSSQLALATLMIFASLLLSQTPAHSREVTIESPRVGEYYLDYCREWGQNCGWTAAHAYCQSRGYERATSFEWAIGDGKTKTIGSGQVCDESGCGRITRVTCRD